MLLRVVGMFSVRSRLAWFLAALAPWTLGMILMMTFAAEAGQEPLGISILPATSPTSAAPLIGEAGSKRALGLVRVSRYAPQNAGPVIELASLERILPIDRPPIVGGSAGAAAAPRLIFKAWVGTKTAAEIVWPMADDKARSDVLLKLRPAATGVQSDKAAGFNPSASEANDGTEPQITTRAMHNGATPKVPGSVALGSTTPVELDTRPMPVSVADLTVKPRNVTVLPKAGASARNRPDFAALIQPRDAKAQEHCLAEAIYFEARSESDQGEAAVAQVVLNRVRSGLFPRSVCGVVFQNSRHRNACQFSFACNGHHLVVRETAAWQRAVAIAHAVTNGRTYVAKVGDATHYHANYVHPRWAHYMRRMDVIGHHIFYAARNGQS